MYEEAEDMQEEAQSRLHSGIDSVDHEQNRPQTRSATLNSTIADHKNHLRRNMSMIVQPCVPKSATFYKAAFYKCDGL